MTTEPETDAELITDLAFTCEAVSALGFALRYTENADNIYNMTNTPAWEDLMDIIGKIEQRMKT